MRIPGIVLLAGLLLTACSKEKLKADCLQGIVIRNNCGGLVIQVQNNPNLGLDNWHDVLDQDKSYDDVIRVGNSCVYAGTLEPGASVWFTVSPPSASSCAYCDLYDNPPLISFDISNVSDQPCTVQGQ